jgi:hypothetical protein
MFGNNECNMTNTIFDVGACLKIFHSFADILKSNCKNFTLIEAWKVFCSHSK